MDLLIKNRTGININNVPGNVARYVSNYSMNENGDLKITFDIDHYDSVVSSLVDFHHRVLNAIVAQIPSISVTLIGGINVFDLAPTTGITAPPTRIQAPVRMEQVEADATPAPILTRPPQLHHDIVRAVDAIVELAETDEANEGGEYDESVDGAIRPSRLVAVVPCDAEKEKLLIAKSMRNGLTSSSNVINEKIAALNSLMTRTIILQNEIKVLMEPIEGNPKVAFVLDKIAEINQSIRADSVVKKAYINKDGNISILTNHVYTEPLEDQTIRDIGELEIIISSISVLSEQASVTTPPIFIKNLTHYLSNDDGAWACGHVHHEGDICFGNVFPQIHRALSDKNFMLAVELIVKFIRNPNVHDPWGKNILGFPVHRGQN